MLVKFTFSLIILAWSMTCFTQSEYAVIDDVDGYVNVREAPGIHSNIVGKIFEEEIFWVSLEETEKGWFYVNFMQEFTTETSIEKTDRLLDNKCLQSGYVHGSRIRRLKESADTFSMKHELGGDWFLMADSCVVDMKIGKYTPSTAIHPKEMWGTDLSIPKQQIKQAYLEVGDKRIQLVTTGFYEPNFNSTRLIYDETMDHFLITMSNSDGAGYYLCVWQISKNGEVKRYAFLPY